MTINMSDPNDPFFLGIEPVGGGHGFTHVHAFTQPCTVTYYNPCGLGCGPGACRGHSQNGVGASPHAAPCPTCGRCPTCGNKK